MTQKKTIIILLVVIVVLAGLDASLAYTQIRDRQIQAQQLQIQQVQDRIDAAQATLTEEYQPVALAANYEKWRAQKISHYRFTLEFTCMCGMGTSTIEVQNGVAVAIIAGDGAGTRLSDNPTALPENSSSDMDEYLFSLQPYTSIDKLFAAGRENMGLFQGKYDPTLGYPTSMCFGGCTEYGPSDPVIVNITSFVKLR